MRTCRRSYFVRDLCRMETSAPSRHSDLSLVKQCAHLRSLGGLVDEELIEDSPHFDRHRVSEVTIFKTPLSSFKCGCGLLLIGLVEQSIRVHRSSFDNTIAVISNTNLVSVLHPSDGQEHKQEKAWRESNSLEACHFRAARHRRERSSRATRRAPRDCWTSRAACGASTSRRTTTLGSRDLATRGERAITHS